MARLLVRAPEHDRARSLGWLAIAWMEALVLHGRGGATGLPVVLTDEQAGFVLDCYALDGDGDRLYDSAFYSRPKGTDKSGLAARFDLFEALGPARTLRDADGNAVWARGGEVYTDPYGLGFKYVYVKGEPMAQHVRSPMIRCLATEEGQTGNVFDSIYFNLTQGPLAAALDHPGDAGLTRVLLPRRIGPCGGTITPSTAGAASKDGGLETHASVDESHLYVTTELRTMYRTVTRNLRKRGKHIQVGLLLAEQATPPIPMAQVIAHELEILGSHGMQAHRYGAMLDMISAGKLTPQQLVGRRIDLAESIPALMAMDRFEGTGVTIIDRF